MTTLYRPVLIETAEQAEALPLGTVATHPEAFPLELVRDSDGTFWCGAGTDIVSSEDIAGWTALVPIEAEEERGSDIVKPAPSPRARRFTTKWKEA